MSADFDLSAYLARERGLVWAALTRVVAGVASALPPALSHAVSHGALSGGKALRPVLCVSAFRAAGGGTDGGEAHPIYDLAVSLELIHAYSLMHDDLPCMDDADLRRGRPTTHRVYGERAATLAGLVLIPLAASQALIAARALGLEERRARAIALELCRAAGAGGMVGGQVLDLLGEGQRLGAPALDELHRLKTGALLAGALRMGALAAEAPPEVLRAIDTFGRSIGLAFQITDDLLDATSSAEALGKNPSDAALGKSTYVTLYGADEARARALSELEHGLAALRLAGLEADQPSAAPLHALARYTVERTR